jgi:hypothetical protein
MSMARQWKVLSTEDGIRTNFLHEVLLGGGTLMMGKAQNNSYMSDVQTMYCRSMVKGRGPNSCVWIKENMII